MHSRRGSRKELISTARRAAWASLAFALRARAAVTVDVEVRELDAGVRMIAADSGTGLFRPQMFLADSIENGAGFMTWPVEQPRFEQALKDTRKLIGEWEDPSKHACEGSCPAYLRDWSNTPFHPIIDWRLAADLLEVLIDGQLTTDRWAQIRTAAVAGVAADFGWTVIEDGARPVIDCGDGTRVVVVHPLDAVDASLAHGLATKHGPALVFDVFNFDRRPGEVYRRR
jgi:hypothetical protein